MSIHKWVQGVWLGAFCLFALTSCSTTDGGNGDTEFVVEEPPASQGLEIVWERDFLKGAKIHQLFWDRDLLYVISGKNEVSAIGTDGVHRWIADDLTGPVTAPPASNSWGVAFLVGSDVYLYDRNYGNLLLKKRLPFPPSAGPVLSETTLYVGSFVDNGIYTVDLETGLLGWQFRTKEGVTSTPVVFGVPPRQMVCFAGLDGSVTAIEAVPAEAIAPTGPAWRQMTNDGNRADLAVANGALLVASGDTKLYALEESTGLIRWTAPLGSPLTRRPVAADGRVYQFVGDALVAVDGESGHVLWTFEEELGKDSFVAPAGNRVYVFGRDAGLVRLDPATGEIVETFPMDKGRIILPIPAASLLVAGDGRGELVAYRL